MSHYSEMDFLFGESNRKDVSKQLNSASSAGAAVVDDYPAVNQANVINDLVVGTKTQPKYVVFKNSANGDINKIKTHYKEKIYNNENQNPYIKLIKDFQDPSLPGLKLKASDFAYLRDLGVYPINRMVILRRFPEGNFTYENLEEMKTEPISTIIGWIKPDQIFSSINFNETWSTTNKRFDVLLAELISQNFGIPVKYILPIPDYGQGLLFEYYKRGSFLNNRYGEEGVNEDDNKETGETTGSKSWGLLNIPIGNPNVLNEAPFRDPNGQNIKSDFNFDFETTYEQKYIGAVDPGSAMLDILDNMYAMGTSDMVFYWGDESPVMRSAREAVKDNANDLSQWWTFISEVVKGFWEAMKSFFEKALTTFDQLSKELKGESEQLSKELKGGAEEKDTDTEPTTAEKLKILLDTILTSTVAVRRFELRGSIELMAGGKTSSTPWHITIGNPYTPWLSTNHIIVRSATVETSHELGFNDMPQWLKVKFNIQFSRALGKQELMRMFNNSYRRTYAYSRANFIDI